MPRVRFLVDMDWHPTPAFTIAYKAGWTGIVTTPCADRAVARGKAERVELAAPNRPIRTRRRKINATVQQ